MTWRQPIRLPARAAESLSGAGLTVFTFAAVEENPTSKHVDAGVLFARALGIEIPLSLLGRADEVIE